MESCPSDQRSDHDENIAVDDDYFNPNIYFVCKLCRQSFLSVTKLLSHKRFEHTKDELKGIRCIIFEERFVATKFEDTFFTIPPDSDEMKWNETAEFILNQQEAHRESKEGSCSKSEKIILPAPCVRVSRLTSEEIRSALNTRSSTLNIDESDQTIITLANKNKLPGDSAVSISDHGEKKRSCQPVINMMDRNESPGPDDSSLRKKEVDELTEHRISKLIHDDEIVDLTGPYVRLEKLTPKQIQSKLKSRSTVTPDLSDVVTPAESSTHTTPCKQDTIGASSPINGTEIRIRASPFKKREIRKKILNVVKDIFTKEQEMYDQVLNPASDVLMKSTSIPTTSNLIPPHILTVGKDISSGAQVLEDGDFIVASITTSSDGTEKLLLESTRVPATATTAVSTDSTSLASSLNISTVTPPVAKSRSTQHKQQAREPEPNKPPVESLVQSDTIAGDVDDPKLNQVASEAPSADSTVVTVIPNYEPRPFAVPFQFHGRGLRFGHIPARKTVGPNTNSRTVKSSKRASMPLSRIMKEKQEFVSRSSSSSPPDPGSSYKIRKQNSKVNYCESQMCSGCSRDFHTVEELEAHEKTCALVSRNKSALNTPAVTSKAPVTIVVEEDGTVHEETRDEFQIVDLTDDTEKEKEGNALPGLLPINANPSTPTSTALGSPNQIDTVDLSTETDRESVRGSNHDEVSLDKWVNAQKQIRYGDGTQNVILFSKGPKSGSTLRISRKNPMTCKLCNTKLVTPAEFKNHCENCYFHNKDRHIYCISCEKHFKHPQQLNFHLLSAHLTHENMPGNTVVFGGLPAGPEAGIEDKNEESSEINLCNYNLPLVEWLLERKQNFPDVILLHPDPTHPDFEVSRLETGVTCKLCNAKVKSEIGVKRHVAVCWTYNKSNHRFCVPCKKANWKSDRLLKHRRLSHSGKLFPLPPFFCIECKLEFGTQEELDLHEKSLEEFCMNMWAVADKKLFDTTSDIDNINTSNTDVQGPKPNHDGNGEDTNGIYIAKNIFEEPDETRPRNPVKRQTNKSSKKESGPRTTLTTKTSEKVQKRSQEQQQKQTPASPVRFNCTVCKQYFFSDFALKRHNRHYLGECLTKKTAALNRKLSQISQKYLMSKEQAGDTIIDHDRGNRDRPNSVRENDDDIQIIDNPLDIFRPNENNRAARVATVSLADWLKLQRDRECPDGSVNVILLDPDPTSAVHSEPIKISTKSPVTCKLCLTKLETEPDVKNHAENCWLHNKDRHIFCITCEMPFGHPMKLKRHYEIKHSDTNTGMVNEGTKNGDDADKALNENDVHLDLELQPLGEWIENRKRMFPDIILVDPDPTSDSYLNSVQYVKHTTHWSASSTSLMCKLCRFKCQSEKLIKCHVQICWTYNKKNHRYCVPCGSYFKSSASLESHQNIAHNKRPSLVAATRCRDCHQEFSTLQDLEEHEESAQEFFRTMKQIQSIQNRKDCLLNLMSSRSLVVTSDVAANIASAKSNVPSSNDLTVTSITKRGRGRPRKIKTQQTGGKTGKTCAPPYRANNVKYKTMKSLKSCGFCEKTFLYRGSLEKHMIFSHADEDENQQAKAKKQHFKCTEKGCKRNYKHFHFTQPKDLESLKRVEIGIEKDVEVPASTTVSALVSECGSKSSTKIVERGALTGPDHIEVDEIIQTGKRHGNHPSSNTDQSGISESGSPRKRLKFSTGGGYTELGTRVTRAMLALAKSND